MTAPAAASPRSALVKAGAVVAIATAAVNVLGFVLTIALGRLLTTGDFGAAVALLGVAIVGQVPALALQAVVARHVATAARPGQARALTIYSTAVSVAVGVVAALATFPLASLLHLGSPWPMAWVAVALVPTTLIFAVQGLLQGEERFTALAALLLVVSITRVGGGLAGAGSGPSGVFAGIAAGGVVALAVALVMVRHDLVAAPQPDPNVGAELRAFYSELWTAVAGMGALLALTNVDVILARHYLSRHDSGLYAAGAVASKIAFWFPQAVAVVVFPRLADPEQRNALLARAAAVVFGLGVITSAATALMGPWLLGLLIGEQYRTLGVTLGLFAAFGAAGTLVQLVLYSGIAIRDRLITGVLVGALAVLISVVVFVSHSSVTAIITAAFVTMSVLAVGGLVLTRWRSRATARA
jgi:O-antigen/teichoic acid export membrane protein